MERVPLGVQGQRRAHAPRQFQAIVVDVRDHDMARPDKARNARGHDADGACAGDEHVLTHKIEGQRRMGSIAERVQDRGQLIADRVRQAKQVHRRDGQIFRKRARPIDTNANGIDAQVPFPRAAVAAVPAGDMSFRGHPIALFVAGDLAARGGDNAGEFVTHRHGQRDGCLGPLIPLVDMNVRAANGAALGADQHVVGPDVGHRDVFQPKTRLSLALHQRLHDTIPSDFPVTRNASNARSSCARVWAADSWVRMRAAPRGTTGKENPTT